MAIHAKPCSKHTVSGQCLASAFLYELQQHRSLRCFKRMPLFRYRLHAWPSTTTWLICHLSAGICRSCSQYGFDPFRSLGGAFANEFLFQAPTISTENPLTSTIKSKLQHAINRQCCTDHKLHLFIYKKKTRQRQTHQNINILSVASLHFCMEWSLNQRACLWAVVVISGRNLNIVIHGRKNVIENGYVQSGVPKI